MLTINHLFKINKRFCRPALIRDIKYLTVINYYYDLAVNDDDNFLCSAFKVASLIKLYQPFCDGNHRTALTVLSDLLSSKGYVFDLDTALDDLENHCLHLPLIYKPTETIDDISDYEKYIINKPAIKKLN